MVGSFSINVNYAIRFWLEFIQFLDANKLHKKTFRRIDMCGVHLPKKCPGEIKSSRTSSPAMKFLLFPGLLIESFSVLDE